MSAVSMSASEPNDGQTVEQLIDTERVFHTPEQARYVYRVAGPLVRGVAYVVDVVLTIVVIMLIAFILMFSLGVSGLEGFGIGFFLLLLFVAMWLVAGLVEYIWRGLTPGKKMMGIRVIGTDGLPPSLGACMVRTLLRYADGVPTVALGLSVMMSNRDFRRLGDLAGGTLVVYDGDEAMLGRMKTREPTPQVLAEAERLPAAMLSRLDGATVRTIAAYVMRRHLYTAARQHEIANFLVAALAKRWQLASDEHAPDRILCAIHYRLFLAENDAATVRAAALLPSARMIGSN